MTCCGGHRGGSLGSCFIILLLTVKWITTEGERWIKGWPEVLLGLNKPDMAPKNVQTSGGKSKKGDDVSVNSCVVSGAQQKRAAKDIGSSGPAGRRSLKGPSKLSSKTDGGNFKDIIGCGSGAQTVAQTASSRLKCKPQPAITNFLTRVEQDNEIAGPLSQQESRKTDVVENLDSTNLAQETGVCPCRTQRLQQLFKPYQDAGREAFVLPPAQLKTIIKGRTKVFTSEIQAKEHLNELSSQNLQNSQDPEQRRKKD
ncbi:hypothetical protein NDU88_003507 [Pleurodeles waltl]|uniref:Uncharacterized protein n=1 Tax=Pleurodeles waltl TaxID=8319 RepID=A0AAV7VI08_PLEWA|nr:hypothetical protein NDU88_003507 [Pleurodeles waltl]